MLSLLFMKISSVCAYLIGLEVGTKVLVRWGMSGHKSDGPLRACVKVTDCCDPSSAGTLTCIKMIETCLESAFVTVSKRFTISDHFFCFGEDD
jgi:hypothetical protein